jgi:hypothetical protein
MHITSPLLACLRGDITQRPTVDPGLAGGLREWLEDGVAEAVGALPPGTPPVVVDRWALIENPVVGAGTPTPVAGATVTDIGTKRVVTVALARGALVGGLFRQLVTTGRIGDPVVDALAALEVDDRSADILNFLRHIPDDERAALYREVAAHAAVLVSRWPAVAPGWLPRTRDRLSIPLAGGRVVLAGVVDLVLGAPSKGQTSVCLVDVRSGEPRAGHQADLHFHGLLETLRSGAPPFRLATYYTASGEIDAEDVPDALLAEAVQRTLEGVSRLCQAGAGERR